MNPSPPPFRFMGGGEGGAQRERWEGEVGTAKGPGILHLTPALSAPGAEREGPPQREGEVGAITERSYARRRRGTSHNARPTTAAAATSAPASAACGDICAGICV
jgi:hypothetical protein